VVSLQSKATGVQIYVCGARRGDPSKYEWTLKAPEAEPHDSSGKRIGKHYAGPTWESNDGSKVVGEVKARDNGPDSNAIPWLLLTAKSTSGNGVFTRTNSIQRIDTIGGKAPSGGCDATWRERNYVCRIRLPISFSARNNIQQVLYRGNLPSITNRPLASPSGKTITIHDTPNPIDLG
jgi:hypothetical protein